MFFFFVNFASVGDCSVVSDKYSITRRYNETLISPVSESVIKVNFYKNLLEILQGYWENYVLTDSSRLYENTIFGNGLVCI